jgi:response regulator of citrate/malate metabolism
MILQRKEDELDIIRNGDHSEMLEREKVKYFEAKLEEMEKEKRALSSTLEAKQSKIDHMLKGGADETTNQKRSEVSHLFEKDIIALSENIIG